MQNVPLADSPELADYLESASIDDPDKQLLVDFAKYGYVVIDLDIDDFEGISARAISQVASYYRGGHRVQDAWRASDAVKNIACNSKVIKTLDLLYGRKSFPFQTLNFDVGTEQKTHSDTIHFHCFPERFMAGVWVALEDSDERNGPLHYYPGSHKLPVVTLSDVGIRGSSYRGSYDKYSSHYEPHIAELVERRGLMQQEAYLTRGQALIWSANILHGGSPIKDVSRTRHSQVTHYYFENCLYYSPLWSDLAIRDIYYRNPFNILTNEPVRASYCDLEFRPPLMVRTKEWIKRLSKHVVSPK